MRPFIHPILCAYTVGVVLLGLSAGARAASLDVTTLNDSGTGSLRAAITAANTTAEPDTITFAETVKGEILLETPLPEISAPLGIQGPGAAVLTLNVNGTGRLLTFTASPTAKRIHTLSGLTLTGGGGSDNKFSAMLINTGNDVTIEQCVVTKNANTVFHGGAFAVQSGAKLTIRTSTVSHNSADQGGGVTVQGSGTVFIERSTFHDNVAITAGGAVRAQLSIGTPVTIVQSTFHDNKAVEGHGGAVYLDQFDLIVRNATFYKNTAGRSGGALFFYNRSTAHLVHTTIVENTADQNKDGDGNGGGIAFGDQMVDQADATDDITITLTRSVLAKNTDTGKQANDCAATVTLVGPNFLLDGTGCLTLGTGAANAGTDPKLQAIPALHGGTTMAFAPVAQSPLINAGPTAGCVDETGTVMTSDQRGFARAAGGACDSGAVEQVCGDTGIFGNEVCDDGNLENTDGCLATCVVAACGDGYVRTGVEACDDGNDVNTDACLNTCTKAQCGDGVVSEAESCDDGNTTGGDGCQGTCALPTCGDAIIDPGEVCDDGNTDNTDSCLNTCVAAICGDGFLKTGAEQCDSGSDNSKTTPNACRPSCTLPVCGDGVVDTVTEACDDGNTVNGDACSNTCTINPPSTPVKTDATPDTGEPTTTIPTPAASTGGCTLVL